MQDNADKDTNTVEAVRAKRPATRAWTRLLEAARDDEQESARLRAEAERYISAANALAQKRLTRSNSVAKPKGTVANESADACVSAADDSSVTTSSAAGNRTNRDADNQLQRSLDKGVAKMQVNPDAVASSSDAKDTDHVVSAAQENNDDGSETCPAEKLSARYVLGSDAYIDAVIDALHVKQPWNSRERVLKEICEATSELQRAEATSLCQRLAPAVADQLCDLRSMVVVAASQTVAACATFFETSEAQLAILNAALQAVVRTKAVMSDAGSSAAKALLKANSSCDVLWDRLFEILQKSSNVRARKLAAECFCNALVENEFHGSSIPSLKGIVAALRDKAEEVRAIAKRAVGRFGDVHGQPHHDELLSKLPDDIRGRLQTSSKHALPASGDRDKGPLQVKGNARSANGRRLVSANKHDFAQKNLDKPSKPSVRDMIRMQRAAMKDAKAVDCTAHFDGAVGTLSNVHTKSKGEQQSGEHPCDTEDDDEQSKDGNIDDSKKRVDIDLSPQKTLPKRRVVSPNEKENMPTASKHS